MQDLAVHLPHMQGGLTAQVQIGKEKKAYSSRTALAGPYKNPLRINTTNV
jgi:hypothetical protein